MAGASHTPRTDLRPFTDRPAFKPFAVLLIVPIVLLASGLMAIILAPPFAGLAFGAHRVQAKLDRLGADFTRIPKFPERSTIYASDGTTVLATVYLDNREIVRLKKIAPIAREAVLAIEDSGFYEHGALNWSSLVRALVENAKAGEVVQGGSTITQQLVKNTIGAGDALTFERKFQELALALRVEERYSKDEILEMYLNEIYMGNGIYGFGTASDFYFGKPATELTLAEGAMLAGMIRAPEYYDPLDRPVKARLRRNDVLNRMAADGIIKQTRADKVKAKEVELAEGAGKLKLKRPPFFVTYLTEQMIQNPDGQFDVLGKSEKARRRSLYEGGLKIYSTLDPKWQAYAQSAANQPYAVTPYTPPGKLKPDTAIVSLDVRSGAIRTMLSGRNYREDQLRLATTAHQPGSSFKPYVLAAAFEQGIPPTQVYDSTSPYFPPGGWPGSDCNCVMNAEGPGSRGFINLYQATTDSVNVVFAQLIQDVGASNVVTAAHKMGITTDIPAVDALATGSVDVTPLEMASGYQTLANGGVHCPPYSVESIVGDKGELYVHGDDCAPAIKPEIAHQISSMLQSVVQSGTGTAANLGTWPVAGKTGTANGNTNVWFMGYTRQVVTAVWVGSPGEPYSMGDVFGGTIAAPIWRNYMARVMQGMPAEGFPAPPAPPTGPVPNVVGLNKPGAVQKLAAAGFQARVKVVDSAEPKGVVVAQTPAGGTVTALGSLITIEVSSGVPAVVEVPKVVGMTSADAQAALVKAGFVVKIVEKEVTDPARYGVVLAQAPEGGAKADQGTTVTITVGKKVGGGGNGGTTGKATAAQRR
jgi:membrane peptidoglycan carboxypeptidase